MVMKEKLFPNSAELSGENNALQFEALFKYATIVIVVTDRKAMILDFNQYAEIQFGYTKDEVLGKAVEILLPQSIHAKHETYRNNFHQHPQNRIMGAGRDLCARKNDGTEFYLEVILTQYCLNE